MLALQCRQARESKTQKRNGQPEPGRKGNDMYKFFDGVHSLDELKKRYRALSMKHHPDRGGDAETMKAINAEHDALFEILKNKHNASADEEHRTTETAEEFRTILDVLLKLDGLEIELCGCWLWIGGNTKEHKDALKAAGCRWSSNKKLWYWRHPEDRKSYRGHKVSMQDIRSKYGSQIFDAAGNETGGYTRIGATA